MPPCLFVSDLHGSIDRYEKLWAYIAREAPAAVFLGGDLLPAWLNESEAFIPECLLAALTALRAAMQAKYPRIFVILGNDDRRCDESDVLAGEERGLWEYVHMRRVAFGDHEVCGYACVPPSPFLNKDWERYDVSQQVEPGCVSPEEGYRSVAIPEHVVRHATIRDDLQTMMGSADLAQTIVLFHAPPYQTTLDRAGLDGRMIDYAPLDVHVGSIAIRRFIEERQPLVTLHGHIHESARLTGAWSQQIGRTWCFSAAHDGPELAVVRFDPDAPAEATRILM